MRPVDITGYTCPTQSKGNDPLHFAALRLWADQRPVNAAGRVQFYGIHYSGLTSLANGEFFFGNVSKKCGKLRAEGR